MAHPLTLESFCAQSGASAPTDAERALIAACRDGVPCILGDGSRPEVPDDARNIRAALLRLLILGDAGQGPLHENGVVLSGAYVDGTLGLDFGQVRGQTGLANCTFTDRISALQTRFAFLNLTGSHMPGLFAQGCDVSGAVYLRNGFTATGTVSLVGARIGGQLACNGGRFEPASGLALNAQGAQISGDVFLCAATPDQPFHASATVSLVGAQIGGQLACHGGRFDAPVSPGPDMALNLQGVRVGGDVFLGAQGPARFMAEGEVSLAGAMIGGQLDCTGGRFAGREGGFALRARRLRVGAEFFWQGIDIPTGKMNLASAHVGDLVDDMASWPGDGRGFIDGFTYDRISRDAPVEPKARLAWLAQATAADFRPQPYTELARVLREMGHEAAAADVYEARSRLSNRHIRGRARRPQARAVIPLRALADWLARQVVGYGYKPIRAAGWLAGLVAIASTLAWLSWQEGSMVPNSDVLLVSSGWQAVVDAPNPAAVWSAPDGAGRDWETFHPLAYGLDLVVPVLNLGQTDGWSPSTTRAPWGRALWWTRWLLISLGWVVSALGAAAITGIMQRK